MESMSPMMAIKTFLNEPSRITGQVPAPMGLAEVKAFKDSCTPAQWADYAAGAAKILGVEVTDKK